MARFTSLLNLCWPVHSGSELTVTTRDERRINDKGLDLLMPRKVRVGSESVVDGWNPGLIIFPFF